MEPWTKSVNLDLDLNRQSGVPVRGCVYCSTQAGRYVLPKLQKIIDWPMSLEGLDSCGVKQ
jgi:hypothetical protein